MRVFYAAWFGHAGKIFSERPEFINIVFIPHIEHSSKIKFSSHVVKYYFKSWCV
uniref:Uncharacterized protein n=1 Tax=Arion vulgaris TaxID=1028688 RepID=A0A0B6ZMA1_9EUPU